MKFNQVVRVMLGTVAMSLAGCAGNLDSVPARGRGSAVSMAAAATVNPNAIFVATDGSDANPGTMAQPLRTISRALAKAGMSGEVIVRAGTYKERLNVSNSGTAAAYFWLHSYPGETVVLDASGLGIGKWSPFVNISGSYVKFDGFQATNSGGDGIDVADQASYVQIINNVIHDSQTQGLAIGGKYHLIQNNDVYFNSAKNKGNPNTGWDQGMSITGNNSDTHIMVVGNKVHENWGEGIGTILGGGTNIANNIVYDNFSVEIYASDAPNVTVSGNFIYNTGNPSFLNGGKRSVGIGVAVERAGNNVSGGVYINNIDVGSSRGFLFWDESGYAPLTNALIANNTFVNETEAGIEIDASRPGNSNVTLVNNLAYNTVGGSPGAGSASGVSFSNNCWYGGSAGPFAKGAGDVTADPKLVKPGSFNPSDYKLMAGSPCGAAGKTVAQVKVDYFGGARVASYSIGAHQLGSSVTPPPPTPTPMPTPPAATPTPAPTPTPPVLPSPTPKHRYHFRHR